MLGTAFAIRKHWFPSNVQCVLGKYAVEQKLKLISYFKVSASFNFSLAYDSLRLLPLLDFYL